tara:strand:- start:9468 stop:9785 length:318 start_codon:yes stop_codon:yes gene_type:complete
MAPACLGQARRVMDFSRKGFGFRAFSAILGIKGVILLRRGADFLRDFPLVPHVGTVAGAAGGCAFVRKWRVRRIANGGAGYRNLSKTKRIFRIRNLQCGGVSRYC